MEPCFYTNILLVNDEILENCISIPFHTCPPTVYIYVLHIHFITDSSFQLTSRGTQRRQSDSFTPPPRSTKVWFFATSQLNSTQSWVGLIFLRNHNQTKPTPTFSQLLDNQTRPNSVCSLISTQLEDSYK